MRSTRILKPVEYTRSNGSFTAGRGRIIHETPLVIRINGATFATAMILATMEKEFVIGQLFSQGIITGLDDIMSIVIKRNTAEVVLKPDRKSDGSPTPLKSDLNVSREEVFDCVRVILKSDLFAETEAVHSAGLFLEGKETVAVAEDLGRHNALDKVIGRGLLNGVNFSRTLAASTGRQPVEMIYKLHNAGIPIIVTKGVPTALAVEIAERAGITVAGLVRGDTMVVYSRPDRIV